MVADAAGRGDAAARRVPARLAVVGLVAGQLPLAGAVAADDVQRPPARALGDVGQRRAVGRPRGRAVLHARRAGERAHGAGGEVGDADLGAVEVGARGEHVGDLGAVRRDGRAPLVAVLLEVAVGGREAARPGVGDVDDGEARGAIPLDGDHERAVAGPDRAAGLEQPARGAAGGGHEVDAAVLGVGDLRAVGGEARLGVLPERHRLAVRGEALRRRRAVLEVEQPHVGGVAVVDEHGVAAVGAERERARALGVRDRLEPPVRRRVEVLALRHGDPLGLVLADPVLHRLSHPRSPRPPRRSPTRCPPARRARARRSRPRRSRPPARPRSAGRAPRARGRPRGSRPR